MADEKNNIGDRNTGNRNTGNRNTGDRNTGNRNTGDLNTGDRNTGNRNTGDLNTGNRNTGDLNTGDRNTGYLNTGNGAVTFFGVACPGLTWDQAEKLMPWIHLSEFACEWVATADMTDAEKSAAPSHKTTGGFLRKHALTIQQSFPNAWAKLPVAEKRRWLALPHFCTNGIPNQREADMFLACTGVDVRLDRDLFPQPGVAVAAPPSPQEVIIDGRRYVLAS